MKNSESPNLRWRKSNHSSGSGDNCVELADLAGAVGVRDSKNPQGDPLVLARPVFVHLARSLRIR
ncbi:uncharacterized protein DUF397 [Actinocorallia herbida]|uniref:Uncharacterized protein DUF397 n=1 Tax=Actinocorallia herbida TaxID=58109 RepID=A0A3N1D9C8_9ACTN|nr:DUF397 domain-containing protein [Actinocorallia herbida]ROO90147.1 uncharacterized protein DUF397 [Actinocorallia herbida]